MLKDKKSTLRTQPQVPPSETIAINTKAKELRAKGFDVVAFAAGEPDFDTPQHIKDALYKATNEQHNGYAPSEGFLELRHAIIEREKTDLLNIKKNFF